MSIPDSCIDETSFFQDAEDDIFLNFCRASGMNRQEESKNRSKSCTISQEGLIHETGRAFEVLRPAR
ncbi:hypothetical protein CHM34_14655 [Paludifilum halophilum]|uniref:Uncharacterized protein n=1 Tax=Paludifilum halophilum TaxID=1642702 RepID=A0A235B3B6_9BACL|nr:hypothetical protein CHM34_14655 [Paludifilum halophilum]